MIWVQLLQFFSIKIPVKELIRTLLKRNNECLTLEFVLDTSTVKWENQVTFPTQSTRVDSTFQLKIKKQLVVANSIHILKKLFLLLLLP